MSALLSLIIPDSSPAGITCSPIHDGLKVTQAVVRGRAVTEIEILLQEGVDRWLLLKKRRGIGY